MDTLVNQYLKRAGNEIRLAIILMKLSQSDEKVNLGAEK